MFLIKTVLFLPFSSIFNTLKHKTSSWRYSPQQQKYNPVQIILIFKLWLRLCFWKKEIEFQIQQMWMSTEQRPPKFVQVLIPGTRENVALRDKSCSADVIVLSILRCGDYLGLSKWEQCNHKGPYKREAGGWGSESHVTWKQREKGWGCYAAGLEVKGGTPHRRMQAASRSGKRQRNRFSCRASRTKAAFPKPWL